MKEKNSSYGIVFIDCGNQLWNIYKQLSDAQITVQTRFCKSEAKLDGMLQFFVHRHTTHLSPFQGVWCIVALNHFWLHAQMHRALNKRGMNITNVVLAVPKAVSGYIDVLIWTYLCNQWKFKCAIFKAFVSFFI